MLPDDSMLQNRYQILKRLGQGGMGAVYLARDTKFGSHVAVKEMLLPDNPDCKEAFTREANLLNSMRHAALSHVIDYFIEGRGQFLVMQYIEGRNLDDLLRERVKSDQEPFYPEQVIDWVKQILDALDYLHNHTPSVLHQDIKPQNLILTPQGKIMLLDFGLARIQVPDTGDYYSLAAYTPPYASWEQLNGKGIDPRSDLFSLAVTSYHLLTGDLPPDAQRRMYDLMDGQADPLQMMNIVNPRISPGVAEVFHSALAIRKEDRPQTAAEMLRSLNQAYEAITDLRDIPTVLAEAETVKETDLEKLNSQHAYEDIVDNRESWRRIFLDSVSGARSASSHANYWMSESLTENCIEKAKIYVRLSREAARTARDLMITAEKAKKFMNMSE
ncbi:MAG TPA: serine/threonine-protein kinase [Blastocatellia bacterium]|nr:serine/threonine-protein kinase [Blastocatellia bacterium]